MLLERLSDLDELILRCRTEQSKEYIAEAVACYRAGAYRAAIVSTWVAVVFDLIDKIRELGVSGNAAATGLATDFRKNQEQYHNNNDSNVIKKIMDFEKNILNSVRNKLQILDKIQHEDLERLQKDRNRCGHPSFQETGIPYRPSAEQARLHLKNAIIHVLSQPPVQGKSALAELKVLVSSNYFSDSTEKAKLQFQSSALAKPTDALLREFVDQLFFDFIGDDPQLKNSQKIMAALNALLQMRRYVVESRLKDKLNSKIPILHDDKLISGVLLALELNDIWHSLDDAIKNKIISYIDSGPIDEVMTILQKASSFDDLQMVVKSKILIIDVDSLSNAIISFNLSHRWAVERAVGLYSSVQNWGEANNIAEKLIFPLFDRIKKEDIVSIIKSSKNNDLIGSAGYYKFLDKVIDDKKINAIDVQDSFPEILEFNEDTKNLSREKLFDKWSGFYYSLHAEKFSNLLKEDIIC